MTEPIHFESDVCDVCDMARVVDTLLEEFQEEIGHLNNPIFEGMARKRLVEHLEREGRPFLFAVHHLCVMAQVLKDHFYADIEQRKDVSA
ncbi:hypothetical protein [Bradyrhizobium sp. AUGA SZCCT0182]|uniref:hypothetical protein n=1 Tax=Bradyrhizobium sp. AUGA SZCCT0182 TaxID=2807667 RepID=UPI001BADB707|nr:hypothetical protein [Bradyrhizobium sp. AUGA SZCCT0182]MBR1231969.1 hypothetical protein [Bradyrhizobium sp. AUGA SZCCT0182]